MDQKKLKTVKKILMGGCGYIKLGAHSKERMQKRGYTKGDMVSGIMKGKIIEIQYGFNRSLGMKTFSYVISGRDTSDNPIIVILSEEKKNHFLVVTVMPPIDRKRFTDCI